MGMFNVFLRAILIFNTLPVRMIRLSLRRVPLMFVLFQRRVVGRIKISIRERSRITSTPNLTFFGRRIRRTIISMTLFGLALTITSPPRAVRRRVICVIRLRLLRQTIMRLR